MSLKMCRGTKTLEFFCRVVEFGEEKSFLTSSPAQEGTGVFQQGPEQPSEAFPGYLGRRQGRR
jgi:hypothetical protein